jgi:hypothetical protein
MISKNPTTYYLLMRIMGSNLSVFLISFSRSGLKPAASN